MGEPGTVHQWNLGTANCSPECILDPAGIAEICEHHQQTLTAL